MIVSCIVLLNMAHLLLISFTHAIALLLIPLRTQVNFRSKSGILQASDAAAASRETFAATASDLPYKTFQNMSISERYRSLYNKGVQAPQVELSDILPDEIRYNLNVLSLEWKKISGMLQQILLWNYGFVKKGDNSLVEVYTKCNEDGSGRTMDEIVLTYEEIQFLSCEAKKIHPSQCSERHITSCPDAEIAKVASCAVSDTISILEKDSTIWAEESPNFDIPQPVLRRTSSELYTIQMRGLVPHDDSKCEQYRLATPCTLINVNSLPAQNVRRWCRPQQTAISPNLIREIRSKKSAKLNTFAPMWVVLGLIIAIAMLLCVIGCQRYMIMQYARHITRDSVQKSLRGLDLMIAKIWCCQSIRQFRSAQKSSKPESVQQIVSKESCKGEATLSTSFHTIHDNISGHVSASSSISYSDVITSSSVMMGFVTNPLIIDSRIPLVDLTYNSAICQGASGEICLGLYKQDRQNTRVALKRLISTKRTTPRAIERFAMEIELLASLSHPNIVRYIGVAWNSFHQLVMVTEYKNGGDLLRALSDHGKQFTWAREKLKIAIGIAKAVCYLHTMAQPVMHRDIKSRNILLDAETYEPALCDFGLSCNNDMLELLSSDPSGTILWTAPEVIRAQDHSKMADIYSFGVVMTELDTCCLPYHEKKSEDMTGRQRPYQAYRIAHLVIENRIRPRLTDACPEPIIRLTEQCLSHDPENRPNAEQVLHQLTQFIGIQT